MTFMLLHKKQKIKLFYKFTICAYVIFTWLILLMARLPKFKYNYYRYSHGLLSWFLLLLLFTRFVVLTSTF